MEKKFDPRDHVVLGYWPKANYACLMLNQAHDFPFVAAYGYSPETKNWSQGHYFATAAEAWNMADPEIFERLSEPVTVKNLTMDFRAAQVLPNLSDEDLRGFIVAYAEDCHSYVLADYDDYVSQSDNIREWYDAHRPEVF